MKIAILGGSFNPLHIGHAMLAETMIKELGYEKVLFIPTCVPPHKEIAGGVSTKDRLGMVKAFCDSVPGNVFVLETCEVDRGGVSYTIDTLKYLYAKYKGEITGKPALLMGEEIAAQFHKWKDADKVAELSDITVVPRYPDMFGQKFDTYVQSLNKPTGHFTSDFTEKFDKKTFMYPCKCLEIPILPISSTEIRARIAAGRAFKYLVPESVYEYIEKETLYKWLSTDVPEVPDLPI